MGFDGVDINMGCPDKAVEKQGCGASLIKNPELAVELMRAARRGAPDLPLSVKTRIGYNTDELERWVTQILVETPAALTLHLRTRKEMSDVPAHWDRMEEAVRLRDELSPGTRIIGNGGPGLKQAPPLGGGLTTRRLIGGWRSLLCTSPRR